MGQQEVIEFLEKQPAPLTSGEIADAIGCSHSTVSRIIKKLMQYDEVKFVEINRYEAIKRCGAKRRIRLYFI